RHAVHAADGVAGDGRGQGEGRPGMIPAAFDYARPASLDEALKSLSSGGKAIAGGQSLLPLLKLRLAGTDRLVDIGRLAELRGITRDADGGLAIGALTTYREPLD